MNLCFQDILKKYDRKIYLDKLRMSNNIDEILKASDNYVNEDPNYRRKDGLKDFARGNVNLRIGNSDYTAEIIIGNNGKKLYLYDVINLRLITIKERRSNNKPLSNDGKSLKNITPSKSSISQNNKNDNDILKQDRNSNSQKLTAQQEEYFKDSKVRDNEGRLMVMYHGTPTGGFTVFKKDLQFFTSNKEYASFYEEPSASSRKSGKEKVNPQTYEVYLNIEHPFDIRDEETRELFINDYVKGGWALGINPYEEYKDTTKTGLPSWEEADNIYEWLEENEMLDDYDGIVVDEGGFLGEDNKVVDRGISYVTFNSNQIKNVTNENPTGNEDIRYQDRETSFSVREPVEETRDLIAVHNLSEKNLLENLKLGGFPMPSIAITKASHGFDRFGDISVVFNKDTIDPRNSDNKVYSGDAWTPVFPDTEWKINDKGLKKLADTFHTSANYIEQFVTKPEYAVDKLKKQKEAKRAFLEDKGVTIERKTKMPDYRMPFMNNENVRKFIKEKNIGIDDILKNKELQKEIMQIRTFHQAIEPEIII